MPNTSKLYEHIITVLVNTFRSSKVRNSIRDNEGLYDDILRQINNLFFLEYKDKDSLNGVQYAKLFSRVFANYANKKIRIELNEKSTLDDIQNDLKHFVTFCQNVLNLSPQSLEYKQNVSADLVENLSNLPISENSKDTNKNEDIIAAGAVAGAVAAGSNSSVQQQQPNPFSQANPQFNPNQAAAGAGFNPQFNNFVNMPVHPRLDPRFYLYKTKPRLMPILKKVLGGVVLIALIIFIVSQAYSLSHTFTVTSTSGDKKKSTIALSAGGIWTIIIFGIVYLYLMYVLFWPTQKRERYHVKIMPQVILLIVSVIAIVMSLLYVNPSTINNLKHDYNAADVDKIINSTAYKNIKILAYVYTASSCITIVLSAGLLLMNPRVDQQKMMRANTEYNNALAARFQGKDYVMDQSMFDNSLVESDKNGDDDTDQS